MRLTYNDSASYLALANTWGIATSNNNLHIVWYDKRDGNFEIYYKRSTDNGTTWGEDVRLTNDTVYSGYPGIAVSGSVVHVVWVQGIDARGDSGCQVYYRRSTDGGQTWEPSIQLSNSIGGYYGGWFPCVAVSNQNVHVVWEDDRNGDDQIYYRRSTDNGQNWSSEFNLRTGLGTVYASIAASGPNLHLVFYDFWNEVVYYKRSTNNGTTWGANVGFPTPDVSDCPCVAVSDSNVHIVFCDGRNNHWDVWYKRSTNNGTTWSPDTCIMPDIYQTWTTNIAVSNQNVHVIRGDMGMYEVHYIYSSDGGITWGPEICLSESAEAGDKAHYAVAVSDSTVHVIWDNEREIYYRRNRGGNPVEIREKVNLPIGRRFSAQPNPFISHTKIPGYEKEKFLLYDFSGRKIGIYKEEQIGEGLPAGVYFVMLLMNGDAVVTTRLRVVKGK